MTTEKAVTPAALHAALKPGAKNGQDVRSLAFVVGTSERAIRNLVDELIEEGVPVCAHPKTGYYIAETLDEAKAVHDFLRSRGLHSLAKAKKVLDAFMATNPNPDVFDDEPLPEY